MKDWIVHLKNPLVFMGFVMMLFTGLVNTLLKNRKLQFSKETTEKLLKRCFTYAFILGIIILISGFFTAYNKVSKEKRDKYTEIIDQTTTDDQSPAIMTKGEGSSVNLTYDTPFKENKPQSISKSEKIERKTTEKKGSVPPVNIKQNTSGDKSPAIISDGDVTIEFGKDDRERR